jgi:thiol-disulfide isomerase/thioredoxin
MRQILFAGIVLFGGSLWFALGDEPKGTSDGPVARKFAEIKKNFEMEESELKKKLADAKDEDDVKQATFLIKERSALSASDAVELAVDNPKEEAAADAAIFALKLLAQHQLTGGDMDKASTVLLENHIDNPKIQPALAQMSEAGSSGQKFLKTVAEKTANNESKALAFYYCAIAMDAEIGVKQAQGNDVGAKQLQDEAAEMLEKAVKLAPEAKIGKETLAKAAAAAMVCLKIGVGNPIPDVEGTDLDGKIVKMSSLKGKVVLFDFWATWCGPCRAMIPHERDMFDKLSKKHFVLLSVNVDDKKDTLVEFLDSEKMPWLHWWEGPRGPIAKMFKVQAYPTLYLIDAKGIVRKKWIGSPGNEVLDKEVEALVAEAKKAAP